MGKISANQDEGKIIPGGGDHTNKGNIDQSTFRDWSLWLVEKKRIYTERLSLKRQVRAKLFLFCYVSIYPIYISRVVTIYKFCAELGVHSWTT